MKTRRRTFKRLRRPPAPVLHPPGMGGSLPADGAPRLEPRDLAERRFLQQVTRLQVRGDALGLPDLLRIAWDRVKLVEALWAQDRVESPPVDVVKLGRSRAMRAQFNGFARLVSQEAKAREGAYIPAPEPKARPAPGPSSGPKVSAAEEVSESAFMKKLRARAQELARQSQEREREQDPD